MGNAIDGFMDRFNQSRQGQETDDWASTFKKLSEMNSISTEPSTSKRCRTEIVEWTGPCLINSLPNELFDEIMHQFGDCRQLLVNCRSVCMKWKASLDAQGFWMEHCLRHGVALPPKDVRDEIKLDYRKIFKYNPFERNLVENPSGVPATRYYCSSIGIYDCFFLLLCRRIWSIKVEVQSRW